MQFSIPEIFDAVAAELSDSICVSHRGHHWTRQAFSAEVYRLANYLHHQGLGISKPTNIGASSASPHDHLGIMMCNSPQYLMAVFAAHSARLAPFNINYRYGVTELRHLLTDADAKVLIYDARFVKTVAQAVETLGRPPILIQVPDNSESQLAEGAQWFEDVTATQNSEPPTLGCSPDDLHIIYTGGTTGMPKGVLWRQGDYLEGPLGVTRRDGTPFEDISEVLDMASKRTSARLLAAPPFMHGTALWTAMMILLCGGRVVIQGNTMHLDARDVLGTIEREAVTSLVMVGDAFARPLLEELEHQSYELQSVKAFVNSGAFLSISVRERLARYFPNARFQDNLGSSETGLQAVNAEVSSQHFYPGPSVHLFNDDLTWEIPPGHQEVGWIAKEGPLPLGYLGDEAKSASTFRSIGGVRMVITGDRAHWGRDGQLVLLGRDSQTINSGGEKIFAEEIELALRSHPEITDALVVGRTSERWGQEVVAVVEAHPSKSQPTKAELLAHLETTLARFKLPKEIVFVPKVSRLANGKADYRWARDITQADPSQPPGT